MIDTETVVAQRSIDLERDPLHVRISSCADEGFWRVEVHDAALAREVSTTTTALEDSFLWPLIRDAIAGDAPSWRHLAHWGRSAMVGRPCGLR